MGHHSARVSELGSNDSWFGSSAECSEDFSVCMVEYQRRRLIGVACLGRFSVHLYQFEDSALYPGLLALLRSLDAVSSLLYPRGTDPSLLAQVQLDSQLRLSEQQLFPLPRSLFDDVAGEADLQGYCTVESVQRNLRAVSALVECSSVRTIRDQGGAPHAWHLALSAVHACFAHAERVDEQTSLRPRSFTLELRDVRGFVRVGPYTSVHLRPDWLGVFRALNHCQSAEGRRLLRSNFLRPPNQRATIESRLDSVQCLISDGNQKGLIAVRRLLSELPDLGEVAKLLTRRVKASVRSDFDKTTNITQFSTALQSRLNRRIQGMMRLKRGVSVLNRIGKAMSLFDIPERGLLATVQSALSYFRGIPVTRLIHEFMEPRVNWKKGRRVSPLRDYGDSVANCVRKGVSGLLDAKRAAHIAHLMAVHSQHKLLCEAHGFTDAQLRLKWTPRLGFHLSLPSDQWDRIPADAQPHLIEVGSRYSRPRKHRTLSSPALQKASRQFQWSMLDVLLHSDLVLDQMLDKLEQQHFTALFHTAIDTVARLDLVCALAVAARKHPSYTRPRIFDDSDESAQWIGSRPVIIADDIRHPLLEQRPGCVANACCMDRDGCALHLLTGPNAGGKSTYLRSLAVLLIMSHIGSFVPASRAAIRVVHQLFAFGFQRADQLGTLGELGTFQRDCNHFSHILRSVENSPGNSIVLVDEFGKGTSAIDGAALAWAALEFLAVGVHRSGENNRVCTWFSTHFEVLPDCVLPLYPSSIEHYRFRPDHSFQLDVVDIQDSTQPDCAYGIQLCESMGMHSAIISRARDLYPRISAVSVDPDHLLDLRIEQEIYARKQLLRQVIRARQCEMQEWSDSQWSDFICEVRRHVDALSVDDESQSEEETEQSQVHFEVDTSVSATVKTEQSCSPASSATARSEAPPPPISL